MVFQPTLLAADQTEPFEDATSLKFDPGKDIPTSFVNSDYEQRIEVRSLYDPRSSVSARVDVEVYVFHVSFDLYSKEFLVSTEFESVDAAQAEVDFLARVYGKLPLTWATSPRAIVIHKGAHAPFGAFYGGELVTYSDSVRGRHESNILLHSLVHEIGHIFLTGLSRTKAWKDAQELDGGCATEYGCDYLDREDLADSLVYWYAVTYFADQISAEDWDKIHDAMSARLRVLTDCALEDSWDMTPHAGPPDFEINPGFAGAWFEPTTSGQGLLFDVFPELGMMFAAWFTYDIDGSEDSSATLGDSGHRWLTAQGRFSGNTAVLDIILTTGGAFNSSQPPAVNNPDPVGTLTIEFEGCGDALMSYEFFSPYMVGEIPIQRVVPVDPKRCEVFATTANAEH
jgi:hypothetical protein